MAQYSNVPMYNHLSTNTLWQLMQSATFELTPTKSQYTYFTDEKVDSILTTSVKKDSSIVVLKPRISSPNVVLIILESFTADLIKSLGGEKGITPNIEDLIDNGILFTNIYASGERTDKGLIAILSSFPSQATRSIIKENHKQEKLPSLSQKFKQYKYNTSFYYGGESEFFGLKSYLLAHSFDHVIDKNAFESKDFNSKWGAHDGVLLKRHISDMKTMKTPFFSTVLTLSNHEPFEIPIPSKYKGNDLPNKFRNTAYYTDLSLGDYFKEARKQSWYSNTLFILVADHGHRLPTEKFEIWDSRRYRIPMIFYGDVLRDEFKGTQIDTYGSQTDLSNTVYNQLGFEAEESLWSNDLLRSDGSDGYGFFDWDNGFGLVSKDYSLSYSEDAKRMIKFESKETLVSKEDRLNFAKAYMQKVFSEYLNY
ncbi:MAG: LTA synthase family protein [bacterium]